MAHRGDELIIEWEVKKNSELGDGLMVKKEKRLSNLNNHQVVSGDEKRYQPMLCC